ncbi:MFS transporter [Rhodococcus pyridinivorans]|uniref:MFS transporter n=1 Tax=Rhodococcus pyridinivorans TaxID=103816 RepID=UPI00341D98C7
MKRDEELLTEASTADAPPQKTNATARQVSLASGVGTLIEYYEFGVYGFAAVVIAPQFFPSESPATSLLSALAVFGVAYVARPLGGIVFGRIGDHRGRKHALIGTLLCMGVSTAALGLLPTYATVGILAPALLILVRLLQGLSAGGEAPGAVTFTAESAPDSRRGFFGSFVQIGSSLGFAAAAAVTGTVALVTSEEQMASWGWRIPFLLAVPLTLVCLWMRLRLDDSPEFAEMQKKDQIAKNPLLSVVRGNFPALVRAVGLSLAITGAGYVGLSYLSVYLISELEFRSDLVFWTTALVIMFSSCFNPVAGMLGDRFGRKPVLTFGFVIVGVVSIPIFTLLAASESILLVGLIYFVYMSLQALTGVPAWSVMAELFPRAVRYTGVSLGANIGTILGGGTAPYVAALMVDRSNSAIAPGFYVTAVCLIGLVAVLSSRETARRPMKV